ncbi:MAG: phenylacetic acid degradation operon negative regulatory protein PaaX [Candidatus Eremiobacteraeota bacterium]|nr:phenylacetic acid degradation operon negative regulatory protein PaaX [Candidatus Eremiobacteraeota bacterium]
MSVKRLAKTVRTVTRPNSFIFTLYGDMVHRHIEDGTLWIGALIALMSTFGLSEPAVRQAVSRMSRQGWLLANRLGNRAYYSVTERGRRRIEGLSPRIYGPVVEWDGRWRMLTYGVAEAQRERRDRLRKELTVLGWAPLSSSAWLSPSDGLDDARDVAASAGLLANVDLFVASYRGPASDRELLEKCWNLDAIASAYEDFITAYEPRLARERGEAALSDEAAFVERMWLVHDYRKFAYIDPGLPSTLLPAHWQGTTAAALFREYYAAIDRKSLRFLKQATGKAVTT